MEDIRILDRNEMTLPHIEYRIRSNVNGAAVCLLEIGRALNDAKDHKLVPHGQWESWVEGITGVSIRSAQAWMDAARKVAIGSRLEGINFCKLELILKLPEEAREAMAERVQQEDMSVRELKRQVAELTGKLQNAERMSRVDQTTAASRTKELQELRKENKRLQEELAKPPVQAMTGYSKEAEAVIASHESREQELERKIHELKEDLRAADEREALKSAELQRLKKQATQAAMEEAR